MKTRPLNPANIVLFGATGDLSIRKILPALYLRYKDGQLSHKGLVICMGRKKFTDAAFKTLITKQVKPYLPKFSDKHWKAFSKNLRYVEVGNMPALKTLLEGNPCKHDVFYLATPPDTFAPLCDALSKHKCLNARSRIVLEKPLGHDLASFRRIDAAVRSHVEEHQIYRIDHYLGKETVQNLMIIRFANNVFERIWSGDAIDHVQITVSEALTVGTRGAFYDEVGAVRDMIQNHLLQLLCLVAMEPPSTVEPQAIRTEKLKVLQALAPIAGEDVLTHTVRGQYKGYEKDAGRKSKTETFVALKAHVNNWRWSGVPFYLRTGKGLKKRFSEIVLQFKPVPHQLFPNTGDPESNKLIIRLQPDESITLQMVSKVPGPGGYRLKNVDLNLSLADDYGDAKVGAYERLLMDVVRGNPTLFMQSEEVEAAWAWVDGILAGWKTHNAALQTYAQGSHSVKAADVLLKTSGHCWHETL